MLRAWAVLPPPPELEDFCDEDDCEEPDEDPEEDEEEDCDEEDEAEEAPEEPCGV